MLHSDSMQVPILYSNQMTTPHKNTAVIKENLFDRLLTETSLNTSHVSLQSQRLHLQLLFDKDNDDY